MGDVLKEVQSINKSLSALGDVISALTTGQQVRYFTSSNLRVFSFSLTILLISQVSISCDTIDKCCCLVNSINYVFFHSIFHTATTRWRCSCRTPSAAMPSSTLMFVNTSPADYNSAESNSSLAFASRCEDVTNQVVNAPGVQAAQVRYAYSLCYHLYYHSIILMTAMLQYTSMGRKEGRKELLVSLINPTHPPTHLAS